MPTWVFHLFAIFFMQLWGKLSEPPGADLHAGVVWGWGEIPPATRLAFLFIFERLQ
jgi:hypothetical protein